MQVHEWRLYIDESGDHTYKHVDDLDRRYLGVTGMLIQRAHYNDHIQPGLEQLKRQFFRYDPDDPPILVRSDIIHRKKWFYVLQDTTLNQRWEAGILAFLNTLVPHTKVFTVVIDKKKHLEDYRRAQIFDPYVYSLSVLLWRVRGYMKLRGGQADVVAESRGGVEDRQIVNAYGELRRVGSLYGTGQQYTQAYPEDKLVVKPKITNVAGLQLVDLIAYGQKVETVLKYKKPFSRPLSGFTLQLNTVVSRMVNRFGNYLLE